MGQVFTVEFLVSGSFDGVTRAPAISTDPTSPDYVQPGSDQIYRVEVENLGVFDPSFLSGLVGTPATKVVPWMFFNGRGVSAGVSATVDLVDIDTDGALDGVIGTRFDFSGDEVAILQDPFFVPQGMALRVAGATAGGTPMKLRFEVREPDTEDYFLQSSGSGGGGTSSAGGGVIGVVRLTDTERITYPTIAEALAEAVSGNVVLVGPGDYAEDNLSVPDGVRLEAPYGSQTRITGAATTGTRVILGAGSILDGFTIVVPADAASAAVQCSAAVQSLISVSFIGQAGGAGVCIRHTTGQLRGTEIFYLGGDCGDILENLGGLVYLEAITTLDGSVSRAVVDVLGGDVRVGPVRVVGTSVVGDCFRVAGSADLQSTDALIEGTCTNGLHITGNDATVELLTPRFTSPVLNLLVDPGVSSGSLNVIAGAGNRERISADAAYLNSQLVTLSFQDNRLGDEAFLMFAELAVGQPEFGREAAIGEGDSYTRGMKVLRATTPTGPYTDITSDLLLPGVGSASLLAATGVGNTLYIGGPVKFPNMVTDTVTAMVLGGGGAVVWEFWNGATWQTFYTMSALSSRPYTAYGDTVFGRAGREQVRTNYREIEPLWATTTIDGSDYYWFRMRVTSAISTVPVGQQVKLGPNRTEINADGFVESMGFAEPLELLLWHRRLEDDLAGSSPGNATLDLASGISITPVDNSFSGGSLDGTGGIIEIADGVDTSASLQYVVTFTPTDNGSGNVELELRYALIRSGDTLDGTIPSTLVTQVIPIPANSDNVVFEANLEMRIPQAVPGDRIAIAFFRDGTAGNPDDTYSASISIVDVQLKARRWH